MNEPISKINNVPPMTNGFSYIVFTEQRYQSVFSVHCSLLAAISYHKAINESRHDWRCCRLPRHISQFETSFFLFYTLIYQTVCVHFQHNSENCLCNKSKSRSRLKINSSRSNKKSGSIDLNHKLMRICHLDVFVLCLAGCLFSLKFAHAMHITRTQIPSNPIRSDPNHST